jgi:purine-nucleoside phosphorylase
MSSSKGKYAMNTYDQVRDTASAIEKRLGAPEDNAVMMVLGTGLGDIAQSLEEPVDIPYPELPGFPVSTVQSHAGYLRMGRRHGRQVFVFNGRFHLYEGYEPDEVVLGIRSLAHLGVKTLVLTNAAGAINPQFDMGTLMLVTDHINFTGMTPLRGPNDNDFGPRFPDQARVWNRELCDLAMKCASDQGIRLERGVYVQVLGPQLETPAETRMFKRLGADAVGMSTAVEAMAAHHMGVRVMGFSSLTNKNLPDCMEETSLMDVIEQAGKSADALRRLLDAVLAGL